MGLRADAIADAAAIVEDATDGFGWPVTVTDPLGNTASLVGLTTDIEQVIDPDTGQVVAGRGVSVTLRIASLTAAGMGMPRGTADTSAKPWVVTFDDSEGVSHQFAIQFARPDRALGLVTCLLEVYKS